MAPARALPRHGGRPAAHVGLTGQDHARDSHAGTRGRLPGRAARAGGGCGAQGPGHAAARPGRGRPGGPGGRRRRRCPTSTAPSTTSCPEPLSAAATPGTRVRVRFSGKLVDGWVLERATTSEHVGRLERLARVVSPDPVLSPEVVELARAVADRWAGTLADVLRAAVPPRHAATETALDKRGAPTAPRSAADDRRPWPVVGLLRWARPPRPAGRPWARLRRGRPGTSGGVDGGTGRGPGGGDRAAGPCRRSLGDAVPWWWLRTPARSHGSTPPCGRSSARAGTSRSPPTSGPLHAIARTSPCAAVTCASSSARARRRSHLSSTSGWSSCGTTATTAWPSRTRRTGTRARCWRSARASRARPSCWDRRRARSRQRSWWPADGRGRS